MIFQIDKKKYSIILKLEIILYFTWPLLWFFLFQPTYPLAQFNSDRNWLSSLMDNE